MKDKVFIGWSGNNEVAIKVKNILETEHNYICYIGGNSDNSSQFASIGDTVIQQIKTCNQAIMIFQNKADGSISNNLFFELGYVFSSYGAKKVHCVRKASENIVLPSDFDNSFVEPISESNIDEFAKGIIKYFMGRQKMSIDANKMMLINNRYRIHDILQSHYSENGSRCSDYELAQYLLFYTQASHMFDDVKGVTAELQEFKRKHSYNFSTELTQSMNICLSFLELLNAIKKDNNNNLCIDLHDYKKFADNCEDLLEEIYDDDEGTFDEWAKVFISEQLVYAHLLFAENSDNDEEIKELLYHKGLSSGHDALKYIEILEKSTPCKENNDSIGLVSLLKAYVYRNMFVCAVKTNEEDAIKYLELTRKERKGLIRNFDQGSLDSKLYDNFKMEYYLTLTEYLLYAKEGSIDKFELKMLLSEINLYLKGVQQEDSSNLYINKIGEYYEKLKG